eukprot:INCI10858.1.p1 GENE.INCI10858.1~~INCI10858.1.p1  ORF type:complete len:164 (-),score=15.27 INCI10858.1:650-1141(-)
MPDDPPPVEVEKAAEYDYLRDGPARYLGYANEVGEAFRVIAPAFVVPSYVVSFGYVFMDTYDKTTKVKETAAPANRNRLMLETAADTLLWQTAASVVVPGFTIHRVVSATAHALRHHANKNFRKWAPTFIGLGVIPLIVHPIDHSVTFLMDNSTRKLFSSHQP